MTAFTLLRDDAVLQGTDSHHAERGSSDGVMAGLDPAMTGKTAGVTKSSDSYPSVLPVLFQHGLGGSAAQVAENFPDRPAIRRLTLECRAQGGSPPGSARPFSIAMFADDILAACDAHGLGRFVAGGISMGAALALRLAVRHPDRVTALILARPAWTFDRAPPNMRPYAEVAEALRGFPAAEAKAHFAAGATARMLAREAPDNLASLLGFFDRPNPSVTADLLHDIATDGPGVSRGETEALRVPTLVIGHGIDHAHPLAFAQELAATISGARLVEIPPKATRKAQHIAAFQAAVAAFLDEIASGHQQRLHAEERPTGRVSKHESGSRHASFDTAASQPALDEGRGGSIITEGSNA